MNFPKLCRDRITWYCTGLGKIKVAQGEIANPGLSGLLGSNPSLGVLILEMFKSQ